MRNREFVRSAALSIIALLCLGAAPPANALPQPTAADVAQSYRLLSTTSYEPVNPQALLAAAADALSEQAHKRGVNLPPPALRPMSDGDATVAELQGAIVNAAQAAHADPSDFAYAAIDAMAKALNDRYTVFFTPAEFTAFNESLDPTSIGGIGVMIAPDPASGFARITYVLPGAPAERAHLQIGDLITTVNGQSTHGLAVDGISAMLRGKAGTVADVTISRSGASSIVAIVRDNVQPPTAVYRMLGNGIGYIWVMAFGRSTPNEFDAAVARLTALGAKALVLDLRNDGGGYVDSALDISSRFIANKRLLTVEERGRHDTTIDADGNPSVAFPVTILVNQYTASASEITAGALQDDGIATLVGSKTFGKGVMQTLTPLPDGAAIKITTAHYLTPNYRDINLRGIVPDVTVVENADARFGDIANDAQLRTAIGLLQKKIAAKT
jgi:carboxyl-terminal processing protease